ncbi:MAG: DegT/DnrJ/EryC1/StrS family aminotransferase [archaeon]
MFGKDFMMWNNQKWYTPAETKIPLKAYFKSFIYGSHIDLLQYINSNRYCFGNKARDVLFALISNLKEKQLLDDNSEILIPGYTCPSLPSAVIANNLKIQLYDLEPQTLKPDLNSINRMINKNTRILIIQYLFGIPFDLSEILKITQKNNIILIEDVAQSMGTNVNGQYVGNTGDFVLYSFGRGKPLPALGGGLLVNNSDINLTLKLKSHHENILNFLKPLLINLFSNPFLYKIIESYSCFNLGEDEIAIIKNQKITHFQRNLVNNLMKYLEEYNEHRSYIGSIYNKNISESHKIQMDKNIYPIYNRYPVLCKEFITVTARLLSWGIRKMYKRNIDEYPQFHKYISLKDSLNGCKEIKQKLITLPTHSKIDNKRALQIINELNSYLI